MPAGHSLEDDMLVRWLLATVHLLALGIGLGAVWARGRGLGARLDPDGLRRVFAADAWWGVAAVLWIGTGLWRLLAGTEKGTDYYLASHVFWTKMVLLLGVLAMEVRPMLALMRWRRQLAAGSTPDTSSAGRLARISYAQAAMVALMAALAAAMARGIGGR
jgi:putative membrane protein